MKALGIECKSMDVERNRNEDAVLVDDELGLYAVSDGISGRPGGDIASGLAVAAVRRYVYEQRGLLARIRRGRVSEDLLMALATTAVVEASRTVASTSAKDPLLEGMACTLTVLLVGVHKAAMAHVGDSRLYLRRGGRIHQLSADHTLAQELIRSGVLSQGEESRVPDGNVLVRAVGVEEVVSPDELLIRIEQGDTFILCTDGLWRYLDDPAKLDFLCRNHATSASSLVALANRLGGHDNISAVVVHIEERSTSDTLPDSLRNELSDSMRILRDNRSDEIPVS